MLQIRTQSAALALSLVVATAASAEDRPFSESLELADVFQLEYASDPQISPDGSRIVYARNSMDVMSDRVRSNLWIVSTDGTDHRPLTTSDSSESRPRWSPKGDRLLFVSNRDGSSQLYQRWMDTGQIARLSHFTSPATGFTWSPDGRWIAFSMFVEEGPEPFASMPKKPEGAEWAQAPKVIEKLLYRADGAGYLEDGHWQLFLLSAEGGTPRPLTTGPFDHRSRLAWSPDSSRLYFSANRDPDGELDPADSEIFELTIADRSLRELTDRHGPDSSPVVSPDGRFLAYVGNDERYQGYQVTELFVLDLTAGTSRALTPELDRDVSGHVWDGDGSGLFFQYDDEGNTKAAHVSLDGETMVLASDLGGTSLGRPYAGGSFSASADGTVAFTLATPAHPADVAVVARDKKAKRLTSLNEDLFAFKPPMPVEEMWVESSFDGRKIQGWIVKPPGFDPDQRYPLILEIHGGPFTNYGDRYAAEIQLYAAAGYVVVYANPRGSTSYGGEFGNLIHHAYPGNDYHDLMSIVDGVLERGYVDPERLFVTGGSGGGVLSAWIVGNTNRFKAAVVQKPVINWYSFVLTADSANFFYKYWFPGFPWDHQDHYMARSPLSLVGNVETPTMLITGERDYRTPISESEQYYQALRLRQIPSALVRIPEASHGIAARPSQLIAKVAHVLEWFGRYGGTER